MGGKSRKSGGVSKELIKRIKESKTPSTKSNCGVKKPENEKKKSIFETDEKTSD